MSTVLDRLLHFIRTRPVASLAISNSATLIVLLYAFARSQGISLSSLAMRGALAVVKSAAGSVLDAQKQKVADDVERELMAECAGEPRFTHLPEAGMEKAALLALLNTWSAKDSAHWNNGKVSGGIYHGGADLIEIGAKACHLFAVANPLHADVFPMVRKMEAEVVQMVVNLFHGGPKACGVLTSGGTESIIMAFKAYRDYGLEFKGITRPEMVVPSTAHAAFDKAAHYFKIKLVHVPVDPVTFKADVAGMARAINSNTIGMVASAPAFPQGIIDPVAELSALALSRGVPLHVDCCLGSFCIAFARSVGHAVPDFDFVLPGVTSISADTHKYGFSPKGTSVIMYSDPKYRNSQYFVTPSWPGGIYASPAIAGSRPGALVAGTWATMMFMGQEGYRNAIKEVLRAAKVITDGVKANPHVKLSGTPDLSVVAFDAVHPSRLSVYAMADGMKARGWNLSILQFPVALHISVTFANAPSADQFVEDMNAAVEDALQNPDKFKKGAAAFYGLATSIPGELVGDIARTYLDCMYKA